VPPGDRKPLRVLQSSADPTRSGSVNPYTALLVASLPREEVRAEFFRWSAALTSRYDLLHMHWPEHMVRSPSRLRQVVKSSAMGLLLLRLRLQDKAVVRTVHNVRPHEETGPVQNWLLDQLESMTTTWVILNDTTPTPDPSRTVLIPHGHYRDSYHPVPGIQPEPGRLLTFGLIRQYKGIEGLLNAFRRLPESEGLSLFLAGRPDSAATREGVSRIAGTDPRINLDLRFLDEPELTAGIQRAEMVVLPYRDMHNSGAALLALSLNRPIIVPSTPTTEQLVKEFGSEWVVTYDGELDDRILSTAIADVRARSRAVEGVDMHTRDWSVLGQQLAAVYRDAVSRRGSRSARRRASRSVTPRPSASPPP